MNRIGIDLGGTKIEGILLDDRGDIIDRKRIPTEQDEGYTAIVDRIVDLTRSLLKKGTSVPVGICTPGAIDPDSGRLKNSNTFCLIAQPLKEDLEERLGIPVYMENDANCFALAEAELGAAKGYAMVFGVIMGTGVGGGIVINGKIHRGPNYIAGEWGHHVLYPNGNECYCGNKGCVETYLSGPALEKQWQNLTGKKHQLKDIANFKYHQQYVQWKDSFLLNYGRALSHIIDILDPDAIVLGGGVSNVDMLYNEGIEAVYKEVFSEKVVTPILKNRLGDSAGVFGAAMLGGHV